MLNRVFGDGGSALAGPAATTFGIKVIGAGLAFATQVLLARWLGSEEYGIYVYIIAWVMLLAIPVGLGYPQATVRFVSIYVATESWSALKGLFRWIGKGFLVLAIGLALAVAAYIVGTRPEYPVLVAVVAGLIPLRALLTVQIGVGQGFKRMALAYAPDLIVRPLLIVAFAYAAHVGLGHEISVNVVVLSTLGAFAVAALGQQIMLLRRVPGQVRAVKPEYRVREWNRVAFPLLLGAGFLVVLNRTDVIMLGMLDGNVAVAHYDAAFRVATLASFVLLSLNSIAAPSIAAAHASNDKAALQGIATQTARLAFWPSLAICIGLAIAAGPILGMFGSDFRAAKVVLYVLLVGGMINAAAGSVGNFMTMTGYERQSALIFGVSALVNIILNAILIPRFGSVGAALATASTMAMWNVWMCLFVYKHLGVRSTIMPIRVR